MPKSQGTSRKGKPKKAERAAGMGRALKKSQGQKFKVKSNGSSRHGAGMQASGATSIGISDKSELQASNNGMKSVLEVDDLTDFLAKAELANREFSSEREQFLVVDDVAQQVVVGGVPMPMPTHREDDVSYGENDLGSHDFRIVSKQNQHQQQKLANMFDFRELAVPRRPKWDHTTTPEQLDQNEKEAFLKWRRAIAVKEEQIMASKSIASGSANSVSVTPFEKNLQVWRQLWRVLERSDCIVLVVDGRNPLFYISMDLRTYVEEELGKSLIVVVNKCDYLSEKQRYMWHQHFLSLDGLEHVFFSAVVEQKVLDEEAKAGVDCNLLTTVTANGSNEPSGNLDGNDSNINDRLQGIEEEQNATHKTNTRSNKYPTVLDPESIGIRQPLSRTELLDILCKYNELKGIERKIEHSHEDDDDDGEENPSIQQNSRVEFGMVGFPNVGKSSVLNVLVGASKNDHKASRVGVAAQPGKTKHFQTLNVPDYENITLCDCPGLVFPSFVSSQADLILAGVYPLAQVRDFWPAVELICRRIPREILEIHFGVELPRPTVLDIAQRGGNATLQPPTAEELLTSYCVGRSLLAASSGIPDFHKASRIVLKDYVNGGILYCHCPPQPDPKDDESPKGTIWEEDFYRETITTALLKEKKLRDKLEVKVEEAKKQQQEQLQNEDEVVNSFDDLDIFDVIGGEEAVQTSGTSKGNNGGKRGKKHKSMQKWGKKGRKNRNKDPYGCHSEPDAELFGAKGGSGVVVSAGKYSTSNYTRPSYKGIRSAVQ